MSAQWFYIQRWAKKRWEYVGVELSFTDAKSLFKTLDNENEWRGIPTPLALLQKRGEWYGCYQRRSSDSGLGDNFF